MNLDKDIQEIDCVLAQKGIPISARPLHAIMEFGKKHKISLPATHAPSNVPDNELPYPREHEKYTKFIHQWYKYVYGDRIKHDFSPGKIVLMIKDTPWKMNLPLVFGVIIPVVDISFKNTENDQISSKGPIEFNILSCIENMTKEFARRLNNSEMKYIYQRFMISIHVCDDIRDRFNKKYIREAHSDLLASVELIMRSKPESGQSRWSSLQFCEKYIKAILADRSIDFPNIHIIEKLLRLLPDLDITKYSKYIDKVQCSAGVRYGEEPSELAQAIAAHEHTIDLISKLKRYWLS